MRDFREGIHYDTVGLKHYRFLTDMVKDTGILPPEGKDIKTKFGRLRFDGVLILYKGFCYDGATGAIDTPAVMWPAAVHDWGCEAVNNGDLPKEYRLMFDELFSVMLKENGLDGNILADFRRSYMSFAVKKWGKIKHG